MAIVICGALWKGQCAACDSPGGEAQHGSQYCDNRLMEASNEKAVLSPKKIYSDSCWCDKKGGLILPSS